MSLRYGRFHLLPGLVALVAVCLPPGAVVAQEPPRPVFGVGLDVVNLTVTVRDKRDKLVTDLTREDFTVLEGGRAQEILLFGRAHDPGEDETMALDLGLLMDTSQSMLKMLELSRHAAVRFLDTIPRARELLTIFFDEDIRISRYDSENQQGLFDRLADLEGSGKTALYDAITVYLSRVQDTRGRKVLVLFSDGEDTMSSVGQSELLYLVRSSPVTIYCIGFRSFRPGSSRSFRSRVLLDQLATLSGGKRFGLSTASEISEIYDEILDELEAQYVIGFVSDDLDKDGEFRELEVRVSRPKLEVRHRTGYFARPSDDEVEVVVEQE